MWKPETGDVLVTDGGKLGRLHAGPHGRLSEFSILYTVEYPDATNLAFYTPAEFFDRFRLDDFQAWGTSRW